MARVDHTPSGIFSKKRLLFIHSILTALDLKLNTYRRSSYLSDCRQRTHRIAKLNWDMLNWDMLNWSS